MLDCTLDGSTHFFDNENNSHLIKKDNVHDLLNNFDEGDNHEIQKEFKIDNFFISLIP